MTIFSSTEPKFVIFFYRNHLEKYFAQLVKRSFTFRLFVSAVGSLLWPDLFWPRVISICPSLWPDWGRGKQQLRSFTAHFLKFISKIKKKSIQSDIQCGTRFVSQNWWKSLVFATFFLEGGGGGQGSDYVIVSDRFSSEKFSHPVVGGNLGYGGCEPRIEGNIQCTKRYCTIWRKWKNVGGGGGGGAIFEPKTLSMYLKPE